MLLFSSPVQGQIPTNVFTRVLLIQGGDISGSGFTIDVDGRQYIVTAKHVVSKVNDNDSIRLRRLDAWTSTRVKVLRCDDPIDIAVLIPDKQVTLNYFLEPSASGLQIGQDTYFLGFPYGQLFSDIKFKQGGDHMSVPFIRKATWSASTQESKGVLIFLDGHNNPGLSGGPIVFYPLDRPGYVMKVLGLVSGYKPEFQKVFTPKKIEPNEDLRDVEPWRIVTIRGERFKLEDTEQMVDTNSGMVIGYSIEPAVELIKKRPEGPKVTE